MGPYLNGLVAAWPEPGYLVGVKGSARFVVADPQTQ